MSNFLQICQNVRSQSGISGSGPSNVTGQTAIYADVVRWVTESYNEIQTEHENWNFLHNTYSLAVPAFFDTITMPVEGVRVISHESFVMQDINGKRLRIDYVPWSVWKVADKLYLDEDNEEGVPEYVTQLPNKSLKFHPTIQEDGVIHFEGYREPHIMVNSTDVPIIPTQYQTLIEFKALMKYSSYYNATEVFKANDLAYKELLSKMKFSELPKDNTFTRPLVYFA